MTESSLTTSLASASFWHNSRVLIITSCTGEKRFKPTNQLTLEDFKDSARLQSRSRELAEFACPASQMYTGLQHLRVIEGVELLRQSFGQKAVDLVIISAGYGLIPENQIIVPYEVTFNTMKRHEVDEWSKFLEVPQAFEKAIFGYDLVFLLLGENYLRSLSLPVTTKPEQTLIFLASKTSKSYIRDLTAKTFVVTLSNAEAKHYRYGLVGLKGFLFKQFAKSVSTEAELLQRVYEKPEIFTESVERVPTQLERPLGLPEVKVKNNQIKKKKVENQSQEENEFLPIPDLPPAPNIHLGMQYFIPDWDDRVDPGYDFLNDMSTPSRNLYENDVYAHEIFQFSNYDGILVSKVVVENSKSKKSKINEIGIHKFIRFQGSVMGDCGAFGYFKEEVPPYSTEEILDYYESLGFNYGVSIDHLIVGPFTEPGVREKRYSLTIKNAEDFIQKHRSGEYTFTPIGAVQGWNPESYAEAVKAYIAMGYEYIALGGLARTPSQQIIEILKEIHPHLTSNTRLHLFGVARISATPAFRHLGVTSFDSASPLRRAWLDPKANYYTMTGKKYAAVRIPFVDKHSIRIKHLLESGFTRDELVLLEQNAIQSLREFDKGNLSIDETLEILLAYDELLELPRNGKVEPKAKERRQKLHTQMYRELLQDKPWKQCDCKICQTIGVETIIFRGNDRNRRRGFHNTYVFYKQFQEFLRSQK